MSTARMDREEKNEIEFNLLLKLLDQHESEFLKKVREIHKNELSFVKKLPEIISLLQIELIQILVKLANHEISMDEAPRLVNRANIFNYFMKPAFLENKIAGSSIQTFEVAYRNFSTKYRERVQAQAEQLRIEKTKLETQVKQLEMQKDQLVSQVEQFSGELTVREKVLGWLQNKLQQSEIDLQVTQSRLEDKKTTESNQDSQSPSAKNFSNHSNSMWAQKQSTVSSPEKPLEKRSLRSRSI